MDINKEFEGAAAALPAFQTYFKTKGINTAELFRKRPDGEYLYGDVRINFEVWKAAKANAVPKGFALVNQKELLELTIAINAVDLATHTESKTNEVREMWQQVALKLMALGTAQEPSHD